MDAGNGSYLISAHASPIRGGATGADAVAYQTAQDFCAQKGGMHAIVSDASERDVYQGASGGSFAFNQWNGSGGFASGVFASGNANMRFKCSM